MTVYLDNKRVTQEKVEELIGKQHLEQIVKEAKEKFMENPYMKHTVYTYIKGHFIEIHLF